MASKLFSPITIAGIAFANRIVVSPMCQYNAQDGSASDWHVVHLGQFALSGAGLLMIEATGVEPAGRITHGCLGLYSDANEEALARVLGILRKTSGMPVGIQLAHSGRKGSSELPWRGGQGLSREEGGWTTSGASPIPYGPRHPAPEPLDRSGMERVRDAFAAATARARRIGLDVVELHAAHGYLLHQFLTPITNRRTDAYGGTLENRMRFPLEVAAAMREEWPRGRVLGARINSVDFVEGGATIEDAVAFARELKRLGFDYVCASAGSLVSGQQFPVEPGFLLPRARTIRRETGMVTQGTALIVTPQMAEEAIAGGSADMIAIARGFLDDPRWPWHAAEALGMSLEFRPEYRSVDPSVWRGAPLRPHYAPNATSR